MSDDAIRAQERERIGRLLHDDLQQLLVAASLRIDAALDHFGREPIPANLRALEDLRAAYEAIALAIAQSRDLSRSLCALPDRGPLSERLHQLTKTIRQRFARDIDLDVDDDLPGLDEPTITAILQGVRELVVNAIKHAPVGPIRVRAMRRGDDVCIDVTDAGPGPAPPTVDGGLAEVARHLARVGGGLRFAPGGPRLVVPSGPHQPLQRP